MVKKLYVCFFLLQILFWKGNSLKTDKIGKVFNIRLTLWKVSEGNFLKMTEKNWIQKCDLSRITVCPQKYRGYIYVGKNDLI
jgi:hypothetical protein